MPVIAEAVIDASVALKWVIDEPGSESALALAGARLWAPALLRVECASALWRKVRTHELDGQQARGRLAALERAPVTLAADENLTSEALRLSLDLEHPVYDCLYLALAIELEVPVITADRRFIRAVHRHAALADRLLPLDSAG